MRVPRREEEKPDTQLFAFLMLISSLIALPVPHFLTGESLPFVVFPVAMALYSAHGILRP